MPESLLVSIIIPAFGRTDMLRKAVRSALGQDFESDKFEVIVVDSSPDKANVEMLTEIRYEARCAFRWFRKKPEGPGPSRNLGAKEARGQFLAFLDSDCRASTTWLRDGLTAFDEKVGLVQGRVIPDPEVPHSAFNRTLEVSQETWAYETANIFYRRLAFEQAGGFIADRKGDRQKLVGGEDVDLAWKVKRAGWQSRFAAKALVVHACVRVPAWEWFFDWRIGAVPMVVRMYPELRRFFYARYFFNETQALMVLAVAGLCMSYFSLFGALLIVPYVLKRAAEPSRSLKGPARLLRVILYFPRDIAMLVSLFAGSIRYRSLLL